jgi:hypothetical protein
VKQWLQRYDAIRILNCLCLQSWLLIGLHFKIGVVFNSSTDQSFTCSTPLAISSYAMTRSPLYLWSDLDICLHIEELYRCARSKISMKTYLSLPTNTTTWPNIAIGCCDLALRYKIKHLETLLQISLNSCYFDTSTTHSISIHEILVTFSFIINMQPNLFWIISNATNVQKLRIKELPSVATVSNDNTSIWPLLYTNSRIYSLLTLWETEIRFRQMSRLQCRLKHGYDTGSRDSPVRNY